MTNIEKRAEARMKCGDSDNAFIRIPLPFPKDTFIEKELEDISRRGASFSTTLDEGYLLPKTPLENILITYRGKDTIVKNGEVVYTTRLKSGSDWMRIGVRFKRKGHEQQNMYPIRPDRYEKDFFGDLEKYASFKDEAGIEHLFDILNVSRYGIAFATRKNSIIFKISSVIRDFKVVINSEEVFTGDVVVSHITETEDHVIIGAEFRENVLHIDKITSLKKKASIKTEITSYVDGSIFSYESIDGDFKQSVADIGYVLSKVKSYLDEEEKRIADLRPPDREEVANLILGEVAAKTYNRLYAMIEEMNEFGVDLDLNKKKHDRYKAYFQTHLNPYLLSAPIAHRVFSKPLGFAGDYESMNMIYRNIHEGSTLFAKYIHKHMCELKTGRTNRNRVAYLLDKIRRVTDSVVNEEGREAKIMTVGCGPAIEFQKFVELDENSNHTVVTLVDFEKEALEHAKEKILEHKILHSRNLKMYPRLFTILQMIKDFKRGKEIFEKQDLIYCSGLFEYLNASTCKALIALFYKYLNPGGQIIIGNFDEACAYRYYIEYCGEWYMVYRNEELMIDLASELKNTKAVFVEKEDTGYNDFLVIKN